MSTTLDVISESEQAVLDLHKEFLKDSDPALKPLNEAGIRRFEAVKFPHRKHEMYTFVNTHDLTETRFQLTGHAAADAKEVQAAVYPSCQDRVIVFVNGVYDEKLSNTSGLEAEVKITPLVQAIQDEAVQEYLLATVEEENDVFAALNSGFAKDGLVVSVAEKAVIEKPLQVLYVSTGTDNGTVASHPRLLVKLQPRAEFKLAVKFIGQGAGYFVNAVQDFLVDPDAGLTYWQVQRDDPAVWHMSKTRVHLHRNSRFVCTNGSSGSRLARHHYEVRLKDEGAELNMNGISVLENEEQAHNFVRVHHEAPHCTSNQFFRNVINNKARSSFDGTVIVDKGAQLTNSDQLINNLMLSDDGKADAKPNLMIFADDVKCTHGATVGQIDEDQLFYLKTRGLSEAVGKSILTKSFVTSIIDAVPFEDVVRDFNQYLLKKLEADNV
ncbi:putative Iron-sulfur cluster assembly protein SufD [Nitrospina gracilis 3/211]|uniref:Putative Iron-sulfur cluster assembly protein SufD n=1 Tax=Nitrospina gracilis (strain 3/211) TaxID=1266370 RepID=M1YUS4_NITG3|nr:MULTISPECIES: Fe-S cluster assembly protein SufD [Nitrospina]MCF8722147.1 Fe-S cluster assembly protein SufD [Nitrospina sp. Nb-3]CCQ89338.1 putative Iron-sulfur cluster assembly protein SufD [Nitrospina gracilis 3/211]